MAKVQAKVQAILGILGKHNNITRHKSFCLGSHGARKVHASAPADRPPHPWSTGNENPTFGFQVWDEIKSAATRGFMTSIPSFIG